MAADTTMVQQQPPTPNPDLKSLDRLVGTWNTSGEAHGQIRFEWSAGGHFLIQHFELEYGGRKLTGMGVVGHLQRIGEEPSTEIWSRVYSFVDGVTPDYVFEVVDDTLTIWFGHKGSDNRFKGTFSPDGKSFAGAWAWPGGGYSISGTRVA